MPNDRCVNCSRPKEQHADSDLHCPHASLRTTYATMALPEGRTCKDCDHFRPTCSWMLDRNGTETACDFYPIRFLSLPGMRALFDGAEIVKGIGGENA